MDVLSAEEAQALVVDCYRDKTYCPTVEMVVHASPDELLVVRQNGDSAWSLPQGRVQEDETFYDTAVRKCATELGLQQVIGVKFLGATAVNTLSTLFRETGSEFTVGKRYFPLAVEVVR